MRFGLMEDFRNPLKWRRPFPDLYRDILAQIKMSEDLGFDHVWLTEHHFTEDGYNPSILPTAAAIAAQTNRIRIATFILLMPYNHPVRIAEDVANVDIISNGRFDFGVGQGYSYHEFKSFCIDRKTRARRLYEAMDIYERIHKEERVTFKGEFTQIEDVFLSPKPVQQPHPPIWVGARGPKGIKRAAQHGYNFMATFGPDPAPLYQQTLKEAGYNPDDFKIAQLRMGHIADSEDQAWDECQDHLFHLLEFYQDILEGANDAEGDDQPLPIKEARDIRDSALNEVFLVGTVDQVAEKLDKFCNEFICTDFVFNMQLPGMDVATCNRAIERFAKEVMPAFRDR
jgi:alkanesulfonate monooxygenase SsuD/methylene tetrahydromethanopterin reductase-like flavin-dependent oxidoreductase (luciferase family)